MAGESFQATHQVPVLEGSAWLRERIGRRIRQCRELGYELSQDNEYMVLVPLGDLAMPGTEEDRTCDKCRAYVPSDPFVAVSMQVAPSLILVGGMCISCAKGEGLEP